MMGIKFKPIDQRECLHKRRKEIEDALRKNLDRVYDERCREFLARTGEEHFQREENPWDLPTDIEKCDICGARPYRIWQAQFSFCQEYPCGLHLCEDCILALAEEVKSKT